MPAASEKDLKAELREYRDRYTTLKDDQLFIAWFLRAYVVEADDTAVQALCGGPHDKGIDAVCIDGGTDTVVMVQGKHHKGIGSHSEKQSEVMSFVAAAEAMVGDRDCYTSLVQSMSTETRARVEAARARVLKRRHRLLLYYVTTGRVSKTLIDDAEHRARGIGNGARLEIVDGSRLLRILTDYLDGVAPPIPQLELEVEGGRGVHSDGIVRRRDLRTRIDSWVFSISARSVGNLFHEAGPRLFARNVRGFLGNTQINRSMESTLQKEPDYFWYYNNGITIICDDSSLESSKGRDILRVRNPQIINGQQTTRCLARHAERAHASVLVRVIQVPRDGRESRRDSDRFERLVSQIVAATNWQNAIRPSDLMSNDRMQVEIERQLRKLQYYYVRKRMTKGEAKRAAGAQNYRLVKKDEMAQAVAGCEMDPAIVREGKEGLFEERYYKEVFPTTDPHFYLSRYWLMRAVGSQAKGYPERAYAKWLVLNFMWTQVASHLRARAKIDAFRTASEKRKGCSIPLGAAANAVFKEAIRFYKQKRTGTGERAQDISTFFQRRGLHEAFATYWRGSHNRSRGIFAKKMKKFGTWLREEAEAPETISKHGKRNAPMPSPFMPPL